jgi:hypothetical protein
VAGRRLLVLLEPIALRQVLRDRLSSCVVDLLFVEARSVARFLAAEKLKGDVQ